MLMYNWESSANGFEIACKLPIFQSFHCLTEFMYIKNVKHVRYLCCIFCDNMAMQIIATVWIAVYNNTYIMVWVIDDTPTNSGHLNMYHSTYPVRPINSKFWFLFCLSQGPFLSSTFSASFCLCLFTTTRNYLRLYPKLSKNSRILFDG